ncbi:hypothetical protein EYF80_057283 [Liparis tanakae]|uniref:Uncharacterized protein n=1 Tax=Liparis tanakae TaxID=230148 RepID=A0A4Z2EUM6_9TELE|nr:hypothetical protein EYF80_057283 [Liparis tanakae]
MYFNPVSPRIKQSFVKPKAADRDHRQHGARFPFTDSSGQKPADQSPGAPALKSAVGFQRFLNVLNKGVDVATLTKIVSQASAGERPRSTASFAGADRPWQPASRQGAGHWSEGDASQRPAAPPPLPPPPPQRGGRSVSPTGRSPPDDTSLQRGAAERRRLGSGSPSAEKRPTPTPEDEHKQRQMQDVLQAIGMNFGSEELGQMSERIQERLYGKKESDGARKRSGERDARRASSPTPRSRSASSSRSSSSPSNRGYYKKKESYAAPSDATYEAVDYGQSAALQEGAAARGPYSEEGAAAARQTPSQDSAYAFFAPPPAPVTPAFSPGLCPPYPPPPATPPPPGLYFPASFPYGRGPPASVYPEVVAQTRRLLPPSVGAPPSINKYKPLCRPRCLQVIETKQPG